jgi:hypothetical protein
MSLDLVKVADTCLWFRKAQHDIRADYAPLAVTAEVKRSHIS